MASEPAGSAKVRRMAGLYYMLQGVGVISWWILLYAAPQYRRYFVLEQNSETSRLAFWLADLFLLGIGSIVAGVLCLTDQRLKEIAAWFVTGAVSYATLYSFTFTMTTDSGWLGVVFMGPAMIWSGVFAVGMTFRQDMFRKAAEASTGWILLKTFTQIVVVWSIILVVFPYLITVVEDKLGIERFSFAFQRPIAAILFVAISSVGVLAAYTMSKIGQGTPLPLDHAKKLVIRGPYAYVRNPMAVSGVGQGLAVALFLGSPLVALYALMGSLIWQLIFRPLEEDDLAARFGDDYLGYCREVKCWVPRPSAYQMEGTPDSSNSIDSPLGRM
ncbi:MAG TPA: isoprenylcysteine carboxylmethyltransferase family protein [Pyrinomonadaceae bacterium]|nr:isoprenylcysteine carboxylmethyltransferase family protein [Pyrinomonadaceae bacterium]